MKKLSILKKHYLLMILFVCSFQLLNSQFILDAEIRPRGEYRHGFHSLMPDSVNPATFISQRTRLNAFYNKDKVKVYLSLQDVRVWGDVPQLNRSDVYGLSIHQAWGEFGIGQKFAIKVGRQELIYDDHRIFGSVNWAQQARSHDALLAKFFSGHWSADIGLAFNQNGFATTGNTYNELRNYKTIQYFWGNYKGNDFKVSFLFLNNGLQYIDFFESDSNQTRYSQTVGAYFKDRLIKLIDLTAFAYYTGGKDREDRSLSAYDISLELLFRPEKAKWNAGIGFEMLSGNDLNWDVNGDKNNAFTPFYGTNHKFNGFMDYFYVGNHINSVGLVDIYIRGGFGVGKSKFLFMLHNFSSQAKMIVGSETKSSQLGNEFDFVYSYKFNKTMNIKAGYSQMFANESMGLIKSGNYENTNNWAWVMFTFKPQFFKYEYPLVP
jgi:hypothetical protein